MTDKLTSPVPVDFDSLIERPPPLPGIVDGTGASGFVDDPAQDLGAREQRTYAWQRTTFNDFIDRIRNADVEGPIAASQIREYAMRMLIGYTGHPDPKVAIKALEMLGKVKNIGLFEEKRSGAEASSSDVGAVREELSRVLGAYKKA